MNLVTNDSVFGENISSAKYRSKNNEYECYLSSSTLSNRLISAFDNYLNF